MAGQQSYSTSEVAGGGPGRGGHRAEAAKALSRSVTVTPSQGQLGQDRPRCPACPPLVLFHQLGQSTELGRVARGEERRLRDG